MNAKILAIFCTFGLGGMAAAANFSVTFDSNSVPSFDTTYNDGESAVFTGASDFSAVTGKLSGINYGDDVTSSIRWGVLDNSLPWNFGQPGGLIRHGFEPIAIGSTTAQVGQDTTSASYLNVRIIPGEELLFTGLSLELQQTNTLCVDPKAWASTSADNFASVFPITGGQSGHGGTAIWSFTGVNYLGSTPLELRIYGVVGADEGALPLVRLNGNVTPGVSVPEPSGVALAAGGLLLLGGRRRSPKITERA